MRRTPGVLAIDQGTTGSTALVLDAEGRVVGRAYSEFPQHFPSPGWVEHDPEELWQATMRVAAAAVREARAAGVEPEALGITNQRETVLLWDRETLAPVTRAIVWQDRRTAGLCRELREAGYEPGVRERTGLLLDPYFSGTKLTWLLRGNAELRRRAESGALAMGTVDSWLLARLTGGAVHATDPTNASRTLLYDIRSLEWSPWLLDLLEVPRTLLPEVRPSSGAFGVALGDAFGADLPILGVAGDQQAALYGQGCWEAGLAKTTFGTGAFLLMHTGGTPVSSSHGLLTTVACGPGGEPAWALEGSIFVAGAAVQWLRDGLGILAVASESEALARSLPGNEGVFFVPAFVGLGAPHWDPEARGTILGLTRGTGRAHLVRAALEAMAYGTGDLLRAMEADAGVRLREVRVDGGVAANDWLMEFQAGILGVPVRRPGLIESTAVGAAGLAGLAAGIWSDPEGYRGAVGSGSRTFESAMEEEDRRALLEGWGRALRAVTAFSSQGTPEPISGQSSRS